MDSEKQESFAKNRVEVIARLTELGAVVEQLIAPDGHDFYKVFCGDTWIGGDANLSLIPQLPEIEQLTLHEIIVSGEGLNNLAGAQNLKTLVVKPFTKLLDDDFEPLGKLSFLEELDLRDWNHKWLTDAGLVQVGKLVNLKLLRLPGTMGHAGPFTRITRNGIRHLHTLKNLEELQVSGINFGGSDPNNSMDVVAALPNLQRLFLGNCSFTDEGLEHIGTLKHLEILDLSGWHKFTEVGLSYLNNLSNLRSLNLSKRNRGNTSPITNGTLKLFPALKKLEELYLEGTDISDSELTYLDQFASLRVLNVGKNNKEFGHLSDGPDITDVGLKSIARLPHLTSLHLQGNNITDIGVSTLSSLKELEQLNLTGTSVTDESTRTLRRNHKSLISVDLSQHLHNTGDPLPYAVEIGDSGIRNLASLPNLKEFRFDGATLTNAAVIYIGRMTQLETLKLTATMTTDQTIGHLRDLKYLKGLSLAGDGLTPKGLEGLGELHSLEELDLPYHFERQIDDDDLIHFRSPSNSNLKRLNLREAWVTDRGLTNIAKLIKLERLSLSNTEITDSGLSALTTLIHLRHLDLSDTDVSDHGMAHLRGLFVTNVNLNNTHVTDRGLVELTNAVKTISDLHLGQNITNVSVDTLLSMQNLKRLNIDSTAINDLGRAQLLVGKPWLQF